MRHFWWFLNNICCWEWLLFFGFMPISYMHNFNEWYLSELDKCTKKGVKWDFLIFFQVRLQWHHKWFAKQHLMEMNYLLLLWSKMMMIWVNARSRILPRKCRLHHEKVSENLSLFRPKVPSLLVPWFFDKAYNDDVELCGIVLFRIACEEFQSIHFLYYVYDLE